MKSKLEATKEGRHRGVTANWQQVWEGNGIISSRAKGSSTSFCLVHLLGSHGMYSGKLIFALLQSLPQWAGVNSHAYGPSPGLLIIMSGPTLHPFLQKPETWEPAHRPDTQKSCRFLSFKFPSVRPCSPPSVDTVLAQAHCGCLLASLATSGHHTNTKVTLWSLIGAPFTASLLEAHPQLTLKVTCCPLALSLHLPPIPCPCLPLDTKLSEPGVCELWPTSLLL